MTVIAWDGKTLVADKQATSSGLARTVTKIIRNPAPDKRELLAMTGDWDVAVELRAWYIAGADVTKFPDAARKDVATLIVIDAKGACSYASGPYPMPHEDAYMAWGSGRDFALAAMYLGQDAKSAVEVACFFESGCGKGIDTLAL